MKRRLKGLLARQSPRCLAGLLRTGALLVVSYHGVRQADMPDTWFRVPVDRFREHLRYLKSLGPVLATPDDPRDPAERLHVMITFDDGYLDTLNLAAPALAEAELPWTVFVCSRHVDEGEVFWFDELASVIDRERLTAVDLAPLGLGSYRLPPGGGKRWPAVHDLLGDVKSALATTPDLEARLRQWLMHTYPASAEYCARELRSMNADEVKGLAAQPAVTVGDHGHGHELLPRLPLSVAASSLRRSRERLGEIIGTVPESLAYPNGEFDDRVVQEATNLGYRWAFTTRFGVQRSQGDPLRIPRVMVGGWDTVEDLRFKLNWALLRTAAVGMR